MKSSVAEAEAEAETPATCAVAQDVQVRVGDRGEHPPGHHGALRPQVAVDRADHHVHRGEQLVGLVQGAVGEDVHLDPGEDAETGGQGLVQPGVAQPAA